MSLHMLQKQTLPKKLQKNPSELHFASYYKPHCIYQIHVKVVLGNF